MSFIYPLEFATLRLLVILVAILGLFVYREVVFELTPHYLAFTYLEKYHFGVLIQLIVMLFYQCAITRLCHDTTMVVPVHRTTVPFYTTQVSPTTINESFTTLIVPALNSTAFETTTLKTTTVPETTITTKAMTTVPETTAAMSESSTGPQTSDDTTTAVNGTDEAPPNRVRVFLCDKFGIESFDMYAALFFSVIYLMYTGILCIWIVMNLFTVRSMLDLTEFSHRLTQEIEGMMRDKIRGGANDRPGYQRRSQTKTEQ